MRPGGARTASKFPLWRRPGPAGGGNRVDVLHRRQRYRRADHIAQPGCPDSGGRDHEVGLDVALGGLDRGDAAVRDFEAGDLDVAVERRAVSLGLSRHRLGRPGRLRVDVRRDVDRPQGALGEHREEVARLGGAEYVGLDAPATAVPSLSFQVGEPFRRPGHLQAAHGLAHGTPSSSSRDHRSTV